MRESFVVSDLHVVDDARRHGVYLSRRSDDRRNAVARSGRDEYEQSCGDEARKRERNRDGKKRFQRRRSRYAGRFFERGIHFFHSARNRDKRIRIIKRRQYPYHAADRVDVERILRQVKDLCEDDVHRADGRVQKPEPRHRSDVGRHHIGHDEDGAEYFFAIEIRASDKPRERKRKQYAEDHRERRRNERRL